MKHDPTRLRHIFWLMLFCSSALWSASPTVGDMAPDFHATTLSGEPFLLSQALQQGPVYLVFWATWCPHCLAEVPALKALQSHFFPRLTVLGINIAINDSVAAVRRYQQEHQLNYPLLFDHSRRLRKRYRAVGTPTQILINRQGRIHYRGAATPSIETLESWWPALAVSTGLKKLP